jgi:hypothetical protein
MSDEILMNTCLHTAMNRAHDRFINDKNAAGSMPKETINL